MLVPSPRPLVTFRAVREVLPGLLLTTHPPRPHVVTARYAAADASVIQ